MHSHSLSAEEVTALQEHARQIRRKILEMSHDTGAAHVGSAFSCVDILVAAYWGALRITPEDPHNPERDRCILSKGHAAGALYAALGYRGFFPLEDLHAFNVNGSYLAEHPIPYSLPGLEVATGSLGHGLSLGLGMALASKISNIPYRVYVLLSDGECNEGSAWEAAMFAPARKLDNVVVIIDCNRWQATDRTEDVLSLEPLAEKWRAFGWSTYEVDGHDMGALVSLLRGSPDGSGKPMAVIARTVKGKGVSFMEDDNNWHYRIPSLAELEAALKELN